MEERTIPPVLRRLTDSGNMAREEVAGTADGFFAARASLADLLLRRGITTFPNDQGQERSCALFFDDWYLYAVPWEGEWVYSLFKLREQEHDREEGRIADGDTPGVTVSFIALRPEALLNCLDAPTTSHRQALNREIDRVVAAGGQRHHPGLKAYFLRPQAQGPYWIARAYVLFLASLARDGALPVPEAYAAQYRAQPQGRLPRFLEENNRAAGRVVCDHRRIFVRHVASPTPWECAAILATHTADTSPHAFAAEIRFHAWFLSGLVRGIPGLGRRIYASAIRADMTIAETELVGPAPYHRPHSLLVRQQERCHPRD